MVISMERIIFLVVFLIIFLILPFVLQFWLSNRESRYPGLVLPVMSFIFAVLTALGTAMYDGDPYVLVIPFLLCNIPTVIHLVIYFSCREKFNRKKRMDRMNIQDL